jgi:CHAT domain-containing protein
VKRGRLDEAEALVKEEHRIAARHGIPLLDSADGTIALRRDDLERAAGIFEARVATASKLVPDSHTAARALGDLGLVRRRQKRLREAAELFRRAVDIVEAQAGRLGGTEEDRAGYRGLFRDLYRGLIEVLVELGQETEAFHILERYRARGFLAMLAERDLTFERDLPADLVREWKEVDAGYARVQAELSQTQVGISDAAREPLLVELRRLGDRKGQVKRRIKEASPRVAALQYPDPLTGAEAVALLEPGTALLSFLVGERETLVFVARGGAPPAVVVVRAAIGEEALAERIARMVERIRDQAPEAAIAEISHPLYRDLLAPAEPLLRDSRRLLMIPDGPLHRLPFAALVRRKRGAALEYLVEGRALHSVLSATVYGELVKGRGTGRWDRELVALGDPVYPAARGWSESTTVASLRSAAPRTASLGALPHSRREVREIARLYAERAAVYVGEEATEERAKAEAAEGRILHFACHSLLDEVLPINSSLVLSVPLDVAEGGEDGLLQAWEVIEQVRVDADLVTLSGCETGLGRELAGEGLVGLTRAFQYAGARSVMASLWPVGDASTSDLMIRFYEHLKAGKDKAEALRAAQVTRPGRPSAVDDEVRGVGVSTEGVSASHPFYWAPFQLFGDWR